MVKFGVILPNTKLYGGVKRFFEIGNILINKGYDFYIFSPDGACPSWYPNNKIKVMKIQDLDNHILNVLFFTEKQYFETVLNSKAKHKVFYHVRQSDRVRKIVKNPNIEVFSCSTNIYIHDSFWYGVRPFLAVGGVNTKLYQPKNITEKPKNEPFTIMAYGRIAEGRKGTKYIIKACEKLYKHNFNLKLLLFDTPVNEKMQQAIDQFSTTAPFEFILNHPIDKNPELFEKADIFVSAEKNAGWANTVAEAMASGLPVIATKSGTLDIIIDKKTGINIKRNTGSVTKAIELLINNNDLRTEIANNARKHIEQFDWEVLADKIISWYNQKRQI